MQESLRFSLGNLNSPDQKEYCLGLHFSQNNQDQTPFFAVKEQQQLFVYKNSCPHLGLPLEWMPDQFLDRDGQYIQCATHGALFRIDNGLCVSGPCQGESLQAIPFQLDENSLIISSQYLPHNDTL